METKCMQETLKQVHDHEDGEGNGPEYWPEDDTNDYCRSDVWCCKHTFEQMPQECLCKLTMGQ